MTDQPAWDSDRKRFLRDIPINQTHSADHSELADCYSMQNRRIDTNPRSSPYGNIALSFWNQTLERLPANIQMSYKCNLWPDTNIIFNRNL